MELTAKLKDMYHEGMHRVERKVDHAEKTVKKKDVSLMAGLWGATKKALLLIGIGKLVKKLA